jgi:hypothetical protein
VKIYFQIQWNIIRRHIEDAGLNITLALILALISFTGLSVILFSQYLYAEYLFIIIPIFLAIRLGEIKRIEFIKICYGNRKFHLIRFFENSFVSIPFLVVLLINQSYWLSMILVLIISVFTLFKQKSNFHFIVPTPFQKFPFEFIVGFRKTFIAIGMIYALTIISIKFDNYNLGLLSLGLSLLCSLSYYSFMEDEVYVWSYKENPRSFLFKKIRVAVFCNSLLYFPLIGLLLFSFYENILQILILHVSGVFFIMVVIFMKYSAFPKQVGLKESIVLAVTLYFPPVVFITFLYFYFRSLRSLSKVLK